ncbi:MAG TPA: hypothetical protein P5525_04360 [Candidatus Paceibacterota bacterium]|nr:hypothetical protein [Candidatus Paceibacterota bacterium]
MLSHLHKGSHHKHAHRHGFGTVQRGCCHDGTVRALIAEDAVEKEINADPAARAKEGCVWHALERQRFGGLAEEDVTRKLSEANAVTNLAVFVDQRDRRSWARTRML